MSLGCRKEVVRDEGVKEKLWRIFVGDSELVDLIWIILNEYSIFFLLITIFSLYDVEADSNWKDVLC